MIQGLTTCTSAWEKQDIIIGQPTTHDDNGMVSMSNGTFWRKKKEDERVR